MAVIGDALHARLKAHAGTYALVGSRIFPLRLPQGIGSESLPYPAVRYQIIGAPRTHVMGQDTGEVHARVQVDCYAEKYRDAHLVSAQVRAALSRWGGTAGGVNVEHIFLDDERDMDEPTHEFEGEKGLYRVMLDFIVHYAE